MIENQLRFKYIGSSNLTSKMVSYLSQMMWHFMGWGMVFWFLIIAGLGYLLLLNLRPRRQAYRYEDPLELAKIRLAKGEITPEEFDRIRSKLAESRS